MSYKKAEEVLPKALLDLIQEYIDGTCLYIPKKENERKEWGSQTSIKKELHERNAMIFKDYQKGMKIGELAQNYYLSEKSIERIVRELRKIS